MTCYIEQSRHKPLWKQKGSAFYVPLWKRPLRFVQRKWNRWKHLHFWKNLVLYGWKQFLPGNPVIGDLAWTSGCNGRITAITDDYIEVSGVYTYLTGGDTPPTFADQEHWRERYDRRLLGRLWRVGAFRRDMWDFAGKPRWDIETY